MTYLSIKFKHDEEGPRKLLEETWPHKLIEGNRWGDRIWGAEHGLSHWIGFRMGRGELAR